MALLGYRYQKNDVSGSWLMGDTPSQLLALSAVAYSFALKLREELDVPVAVIETSLGATPIETWITKEMVDTRAELRTQMLEADLYVETPTKHTDLGSMYHSKIASLTRLSIQGAVWYQGESNASRAKMYAQQLDLLKEKWGEVFGFEDDTMPFVCTQLAPYSFPGSQNQMLLTGMMDAMTDFYNMNQKTAGMVTIYDLSLRYEDAKIGVMAVIHPTVKNRSVSVWHFRLGFGVRKRKRLLPPL